MVLLRRRRRARRLQGAGAGSSMGDPPHELLSRVARRHGHGPAGPVRIVCCGPRPTPALGLWSGVQKDPSPPPASQAIWVACGRGGATLSASVFARCKKQVSSSPPHHARLPARQQPSLLPVLPVLPRTSVCSSAPAGLAFPGPARSGVRRAAGPEWTARGAASARGDV